MPNNNRQHPYWLLDPQDLANYAYNPYVYTDFYQPLPSPYLSRLYELAAYLATPQMPSKTKAPYLKQLYAVLLKDTATHDSAIMAACLFVWPDRLEENIYQLDLTAIKGLHPLIAELKNLPAAIKDLGRCIALIGYYLLEISLQYAQKFMAHVFSQLSTTGSTKSPLSCIISCYTTVLLEILHPHPPLIPSLLARTPPQQIVQPYIPLIVQHIAALLQQQLYTHDRMHMLSVLIDVLVKYWSTEKNIFLETLLKLTFVWLTKPKLLIAERQAIHGLLNKLTPCITVNQLDILAHLLDFLLNDMRTLLRMPFFPPIQNDLIYHPPQRFGRKSFDRLDEISTMFSAIKLIISEMDEIVSTNNVQDHPDIRQTLLNLLHLLLTIPGEFKPNVTFFAEGARVIVHLSSRLRPMSRPLTNLMVTFVDSYIAVIDGTTSSTKVIDTLLDTLRSLFLRQWTPLPSNTIDTLLRPNSSLTRLWHTSIKNISHQDNLTAFILGILRKSLSQSSTSAQCAIEAMTDTLIVDFNFVIKDLFTQPLNSLPFDLSFLKHQNVLQNFIQHFESSKSHLLQSLYPDTDMKITITIWTQWLNILQQALKSDTHRTDFDIQSKVLTTILTLLLRSITILQFPTGLDLFEKLTIAIFEHSKQAIYWLKPLNHSVNNIGENSTVQVTKIAHSSSSSSSTTTTMTTPVNYELLTVFLHVCAMPLLSPLTTNSTKSISLNSVIHLLEALEVRKQYWYTDSETLVRLRHTLLTDYLDDFTSYMDFEPLSELKILFAKVWYHYIALFGSAQIPTHAYKAILSRSIDDPDIQVNKAFIKIVNYESMQNERYQDTDEQQDLKTKLKKLIMASPHTGLFRPPHFASVMRYLGLGAQLLTDSVITVNSNDKVSKNDQISPEPTIDIDLLKELFHACRGPTVVSAAWQDQNISTADQLAFVHNSHDTLVFFVLWEAGRYCVLSRLRTPLGGPQQTFDVFQAALKSYEEESIPSESSTHEQQATVMTRMTLLCQLLNIMQLQIANAFDGNTSNIPPSAPKSIAQTFRELRLQCVNWFGSIRPALVHVAFQCGQWAISIHYGLLLLETWQQKLTDNNELVQLVNLIRMIVTACRRVNDTGAVCAISVWLKNYIKTTQPNDNGEEQGPLEVLDLWLQAEHAYALERYETARVLYRRTFRAIVMSTSLSGLNALASYICCQINDTYLAVKEYSDVLEWTAEVDYNARFVDFATDVSRLQHNALLALSNDTFTAENTLQPQIPGPQHSLEDTLSLLYATQCRSLGQSTTSVPNALTDLLDIETTILREVASGGNVQEVMSLAWHFAPPRISQQNFIDPQPSIRLLNNIPLRYIFKQALVVTDSAVQPPSDKSSWHAGQYQTYVDILRKHMCFSAASKAIITASDGRTEATAQIWHTFELFRLQIAERDYTPSPINLQRSFNTLQTILSDTPGVDELKSQVYRKLAVWLVQKPWFGAAINGKKSLESTDLAVTIRSYFDKSIEHDDHNWKAWWQLGNYAYMSTEQIINSVHQGNVHHFVSTSVLDEVAAYDGGKGSKVRRNARAHKLLLQAVRRCFQDNLDIVSDQQSTTSPIEGHEVLQEQAKQLLNKTINGLQTATRAYFRALELQAYDANRLAFDDTVAALHLLQLLWSSHRVSQDLFSDRFELTSASCWMPLIPQILARIDHSSKFVQRQLVFLLAKVAAVYPQAVLYETVMLQRTTLSSSAKDSLRLVVDALSQYDTGLLTDTQTFVDLILKTTVLWEEAWYNRLARVQFDLFKRFTKMEPEIRRLTNSTTITAVEQQARYAEYRAIIVGPAALEIQKLCDTHLYTAKTPHERWFASQFRERIENALSIMKHVESVEELRSCMQGLQEVYGDLGKLLTKQRTLKLSDVSPRALMLEELVILLPGQRTTQVCLQNISNEFLVLPTKTKPKKLSLYGSDGACHHYLFKGLEDLHLDERAMQFIFTVNQLMQRDRSTASLRLRARHYAVVPFGSDAGAIRWVDNATPMYTLYQKWQMREIATRPTTTTEASTAITPIKPNEMWQRALTAYFRKHNIRRPVSWRHCNANALLTVFRELKSETPHDLISRELMGQSSGPSEWLSKQSTFARSLAVMSAIGYVLGLGDRHLDNILLDLARGEVVHIDYNVCFEKGTRLRVPERVPFRLTQNLVGALGGLGMHGTFKQTLQETLLSMSRHKDVLILLLETFVYTPLVDWSETAANDEKDRKITELNVNIALFTSRLKASNLSSTTVAATNLLSALVTDTLSIDIDRLTTIIDDMNKALHELKPLMEGILEIAEDVVETKIVQQVVKDMLAGLQKTVLMMRAIGQSIKLKNKNEARELATKGINRLSRLQENISAAAALGLVDLSTDPTIIIITTTAPLTSDTTSFPVSMLDFDATTSTLSNRHSTDAVEDNLILALHDTDISVQASQSTPPMMTTKNAHALAILARIREKLEFRDNPTHECISAYDTVRLINSSAEHLDE